MNLEYGIWYMDSKNDLQKIIPNHEDLNCFLQFEIFKTVSDCLEKTDEMMDVEDYLEKLVSALMNSLNAEEDFDKNLWMAFSRKSPFYQEFEEKYSFMKGWSLGNTGTYWLRFIDELTDKTVDERVLFAEKLIRFYNWMVSYCRVYIYQYLVEYPGSMRFKEDRIQLMQYWEYRELESDIETMKNCDIETKVEKLSRQNTFNIFDETYPDRESLLLDFIRRGIAVSEAMKMTKLIRCGRGDKLSANMKERIAFAGFSEEMIEKMKKIRYLKSKSSVIMKLLFVSKLI